MQEVRRLNLPEAKATTWAARPSLWTNSHERGRLALRVAPQGQKQMVFWCARHFRSKRSSCCGQSRLGMLVSKLLVFNAQPTGAVISRAALGWNWQKRECVWLQCPGLLVVCASKNSINQCIFYVLAYFGGLRYVNIFPFFLICLSYILRYTLLNLSGQYAQV